MASPLYLSIGILLMASAVAVVRFREKTWLSPGLLLLAIYGVHCFVDPTLRLHRFHPYEFNPATWDTLTIFNISCYAALVVGYLIPRCSLPDVQRSPLERKPKRMFDDFAFFSAALLCLLVIVVMFVGFAISGRYSLPPHVFTDYKPPGYDFITSLYPVLYVFTPALFMSACLDKSGQAHLRKYTAWSLLGIVALFVMAIFGRMMIFSIALTIAIIYHFRYKKFRIRHLVIMASFIGPVVFMALLRRTGVGITGLDLATIRQLMEMGQIVWDDLLVYTVMIFEGQPVLSHVIHFCDQAIGFYRGQTYLNTLLMRILPFDVLNLGFMEPPRLWYRTISGFMEGSHGRGFSFLAEAYMNFGYYGFCVFLLVGMLARILSFKVYATCNPVTLLWSSYGIVVLIMGLRLDSLALFMYIVWYMAPLLVFLWTFKRLGPLWKSVRTRRSGAAIQSISTRESHRRTPP